MQLRKLSVFLVTCTTSRNGSRRLLEQFNTKLMEQHHSIIYIHLPIAHLRTDRDAYVAISKDCECDTISTRKWCDLDFGLTRTFLCVSLRVIRVSAGKVMGVTTAPLSLRGGATPPLIACRVVPPPLARVSFACR